MILKRLTIENFRQIDGEHTVQFAPPGDRNVTVLLGENGAGKTTILNAIRWCLHGKVDLKNQDDLLSHRQQQRMTDEKQTRDVKVSLFFEHDGKEYRAYRTKVYQTPETGSGAVKPKLVDSSFIIRTTNENGENEEVSGPESRIKEILPPALVPFFFFGGESAVRYASRAGSVDLKNGVSEVLDLSILDRAEKHLGEVRKQLRSQLKNTATGDARDIEQQIAKLEETRSEMCDELVHKRKEVSAAQAELRKVDDRLSEFEKTAPILQELELIKERIEDKKNALVEAERQLKTRIGRDGYLPFLSPALRDVGGLLQEAYEREQIPARIKPGFVEELLRSGRCICGASLESDSDHYNTLISWRNGEGLNAAAEPLQILKGHIDRYHLGRDSFRSDFDLYRKQLSVRRSQLGEFRGKKRELEGQLGGKNFDDVNIDKLQAKRLQLDADLRRLQDQEALLVKNIGTDDGSDDHDGSLSAQIRALEEESKRLSRGNKAAHLLTERLEMVKNVRHAAGLMKQRWLGIVQQYLDHTIKKNYKKTAFVSRRISFDKDFQLKMEEQVGDRWIESAPSSANQNILGLFFIAAFTELSSRLSQQGNQTNEASEPESLFPGSCYPMVMDAPFATMDEHFSREVPRILAEAVPQMVIMTNQKQWHGVVEETLRVRVGEGYVIKMISAAAGKDRDVEFCGQTCSYVALQDDATEDYSVIERVEIS